MAYQFGEDESVRRAILRCAREQPDRAAFELSEGISEDPVTAVDAARKAIKKQRSLLRLARGAMPRDQRVREHAALREAARGLSGVRDADVMIASIDRGSERLAQASQGPLVPRALAGADLRSDSARPRQRARPARRTARR